LIILPKGGEERIKVIPRLIVKTFVTTGKSIVSREGVKILWLIQMKMV